MIINSIKVSVKVLATILSVVVIFHKSGYNKDINTYNENEDQRELTLELHRYCKKCSGL